MLNVETRGRASNRLRFCPILLLIFLFRQKEAIERSESNP